MSIKCVFPCGICFLLGIGIALIFSAKLEIVWIPIETTSFLKNIEVVGDKPQKIKFTEKMSYDISSHDLDLDVAVGKVLLPHSIAKSYEHIEQPQDMTYKIIAAYHQDYPWWKNIFIGDSYCFVLEDEQNIRSIICG